MRWVPNLWELSQLGSDILSWPPTVGRSRRRRRKRRKRRRGRKRKRRKRRRKRRKRSRRRWLLIMCSRGRRRHRHTLAFRPGTAENMSLSDSKSNKYKMYIIFS